MFSRKCYVSLITFHFSFFFMQIFQCWYLQRTSEMAERSRKRKTERASSINKQPEEQQYDFNAARSDDGFNDEYPDGEYAMKRQRNNAAVNKTREKKRQEEFDTVKRVKQLRDENAALEK